MSNQNDPEPKTKSGQPILLIIIAIAVLVGFIVWLLRRLGRSEPPPPKEITFPTARVTVTVSPQGDKVPFVVERPIPPDADLIGVRNENDFMPQLPPIINFDVVDETNTPIGTFDPPLKIELEYTAAQLTAARDLAAKINAARQQQSAELLDLDVPKAFNIDNPLPLVGFWNGRAWKLFTAEKHGLVYSTTDTGGKVTLYVNNWADPPIGWYPPN